MCPRTQKKSCPKPVLHFPVITKNRKYPIIGHMDPWLRKRLLRDSMRESKAPKPATEGWPPPDFRGLAWFIVVI